MKTPLRYQVCETDCGITTVLNAISYLYQREEIEPSLITKILNLIEVEKINIKYNDYRYGMSKYAIEYIGKIINEYSIKNKFSLITKYISKNDMKIQDDEITKCLEKGGVVIARVWQDCEHYSLLVKLDNEFGYMFDPYYLDIHEYDNDPDVQIIKDKPYQYNRKISILRINSKTKLDFSLVNNENRDMLLMWKDNTKKDD